MYVPAHAVLSREALMCGEPTVVIRFVFASEISLGNTTCPQKRQIDVMNGDASFWTSTLQK